MKFFQSFIITALALGTSITAVPVPRTPTVGTFGARSEELVARNEVPLTPEIINNVFTKVSAHLKAAKAPHLPYHLILAGGAVSVLKDIRPSTHDIDFYCENEAAMAKIEEIADTVGKDLQLHEGFLNSALRIWMGHPSFDKAYAKSVQQGHVIFKGEELVIYVADFGYQFISKVDRMSGQHGKGTALEEKDVKDAVFFLHEVLGAHNKGKAMSHAQIKALYPTDGYIPNIKDEVLAHIATAYEKQYHVKPFA